jgi:hypothetical protein
MALFPKEKVRAPKMAHHDRSHYLRTSMAPGLGYPIYCREALPGDQIQLEFKHLMNTQAILNPLYGSYRLQICVFFAGTSLYIPRLWRNGFMSAQSRGILDVPYPTYALSATKPITRVHESSLPAFLGLGVGYGRFTTSASTKGSVINLIPYLVYYDIFRHYYANRQEDYFPVMVASWNDPNRVRRFSLAGLDNFYLNLPTSGGSMNSNGYISNTPISQLFTPQQVGSQVVSPSMIAPLGGLFQCCYMPDRMNVILNDSFFDKNVSTVTVSTVGDSFQVDQLVTAKKLWNARNKDVITNGTFKDWIRVHFGVTPKIMDDMPTFCGAVSSDILFEDIRATTSAKIDDTDQYLGDKGSSAIGYGDSRRFNIVADRPGYVMAIATLVPRVDYYQFTERYALHGRLSDSFMPEYNGIGYQDVLIGDLNSEFPDDWDSSVQAAIEADPFAQSAGKQPAWIEYMTAVNKIRGTFCSTEKSWVLARDMRANPSSTNGESPTENTNFSAYIDPGDWNQPFADQSPTAQNFYAQFYIRDRVRSTVLKRLRPKF